MESSDRLDELDGRNPLRLDLRLDFKFEKDGNERIII